MDCTQARALAIHLPADLDTLARVLGVTNLKDKEGHALMLQMAKPRKPTKACPALADGSLLWWDDPERQHRLGLYCQQDVAAETDVDDKLPPLSREERALWELDQRINDRGVALDVPSIERCVAVLEVAQQRANARLAALTDGEVAKCTEAAKLVGWLQRRGIPADSIAKDEHAGLLAWADMLGDDVAMEVIRIRAENGKSSTAKFDTMLKVKSADDRARGQLRYHQAHTGRWASAGIQVHNLKQIGEDEDLDDVLGAMKIMELMA
jgi:DNA polymerase